MNENEFRTRYAASQTHVEASPELKQRTVCNALQEGAAQHADRQAPVKGAAPARRPTRRRPRPTSRTAGHSVGAASLARRWAPAAAACLVAGALAVAGIPALTSSLSGPPAITLDEAAARCGFSVRAYASDGSAPLAPGEGGTVAFDRDLGYRFRGGDDYKVSGFFSGCLFHVEGEGIARVQAHLTGGALYRVTFEDGPTDPDDPRMGELASWKPTSRGTGKYYGSYDFVGGAMRDGEDKLSLAKLMGATIDVSADDDPGIADGTTSFGLWTNEGEVPENAANNPESPVIDRFDGQTLTVTVTFEDGSTSTQAIELHVANFETEMVDGMPRLTPRLAADDAEAGTSAKSLYGTVVEAGSGPFPFQLDDANDRADEVLPADTIERAEETHPVSRFSNGEPHAATLANTAMYDAGETAAIQLRPPYEQGDDERQLAVGPVSVTRAATPPNGKTPDEFTETVYGWLGNVGYFNKCTQERYGYAFNDDGSLSDGGYCYLEAAIEVENPNDEPVELDLRNLGAFGLVDGNDCLLEIDTSYFTLDVGATGEVTLDPDNPRNAIVAPNGTARLTLLHVLPNRLADDESLFFLAGFDKEGALVAFSVGGQI